MKKTLYILIAIMSLGAVLLLTIHLILQYGLTRTLRNTVLPRIERETGLGARVGRISINLPAGQLYLKDIELRNPEGFAPENMASVKRVALQIDLPHLFRTGVVKIDRATVESARLNVVRNPHGELNLNRIIRLAEPADPSKPKRQDAPREPTAGPEVRIKHFHGDLLIRYLDHQLNHPELSLELTVDGHNLSTERDPTTPWGETRIVSSIGSARTRFITDLRLTTAPLVDPHHPSFDLTGRILEIDVRLLDTLYEKLGIRSDPFALVPTLHSRAGLFENSSLLLDLPNLQFEDKLANHLGGMGSIDRLRLELPVSGSLIRPEIAFSDALERAFSQNTPALLESLLLPALKESTTAKRVLKDLADATSSDTNAPPTIQSDALIDLLGEQIDEIGEDEDLKQGLKQIGRKLFGH